jgi:hypothetical protein
MHQPVQAVPLASWWLHQAENGKQPSRGENERSNDSSNSSQKKLMQLIQGNYVGALMCQTYPRSIRCLTFVKERS